MSCVEVMEMKTWLFQDIATGMDSPYPNHLTLIDNQIIMITNDVVEGGQIYVVDSDSAGLSFNPELGLSTAGAHGNIWYHDSMAYFILDSNSYGLEICVAGLVIERGLDSNLISPIVFLAASGCLHP